jgi:hypothetical protein
MAAIDGHSEVYVAHRVYKQYFTTLWIKQSPSFPQNALTKLTRAHRIPGIC